MSPTLLRIMAAMSTKLFFAHSDSSLSQIYSKGLPDKNGLFCKGDAVKPCGALARKTGVFSIIKGVAARLGDV